MTANLPPVPRDHEPLTSVRAGRWLIDRLPERLRTPAMFVLMPFMLVEALLRHSPKPPEDGPGSAATGDADDRAAIRRRGAGRER